MPTIGHQCARTGRWEVLGAVDEDAFRTRGGGRNYEVRALAGTITISCRCGFAEDVTFSSRSVVDAVLAQKRAAGV
jgi:hypothetical protein